MTPSVVLDRPRGVQADELAREAEWRRQRARRRLQGVILLLALFVVAAAAAAAVWFSSLFGTARVTVSGNHVLSDQQVRGAAGVRLGRPLVRQDLPRSAAAVAELPAVRTVTVSRQWPRTIRIVVTERTALLAIPQSDGYLLVDDQGVGFRSVPNLPRGVVRADVAPTDRTELTSAGVVAAALPPGLQRKVWKLSVAGPNAVTLRLENGDTVFWGDSQQSPLKADVTRRLLEQPGHAYDVSAPLNPSRR